MKRKNLLFISAFFPYPTAPNIATYNRQELLALTDYYNIDAIVPIPWTHALRHKGAPQEGTLGKINIKYPTYYYSPYILRNFYGLYYYYSIKKAVSELTARKTYDIIYSSWLYPDAWVAAKIAKLLKLPLFVSVLGTDVNRLRDDTYLSRKAIELSEYATQIKCVSDSLRANLISIGCGQDKLSVLQNGMDKNVFRPMDKFSVRKELGIRIKDKVILFVGNLKKEKGLGELCHAFSQLLNTHLLQDCRLVVIGGGGFRPLLEKLLAELNMSNKTEILGERPLEVIAQYMNACDVLCLPSYSEGQPNVVMEAMACHTRVVATSVGGTPDLDLGYGNIKLIPPKNVLELTAALYEVLTDGVECEQWYQFNSWADNAAYLYKLFESAKCEV